MDASTKTGRKIQEYLTNHPDETSPTAIMRATGASRQTARKYRDQFLATQGGGEGEPGQPAEPPATAATSPPSGRDVTRDFPTKEAAKPPAPADDPDEEWELEWR